VQVAFTKMNGAGNDFLLIDNREEQMSLSREQIVKLCHRQRGVGADGLICLRNGKKDADWAWDFYNADGSDAEMCGNGARCFARFIRSKTDVGRGLSFETVCGVIHAVVEEEVVTVNLTDPKELALNETITTSMGDKIVHSLNTGVPHAVLLVDNADKELVAGLGAEIRHHDHFSPGGTNVNFVQVLGVGHIRVRTYERGVGETLACGTGVSASGMISAHLNSWPSPVRVDVLGGDQLVVGFSLEDDVFSSVQLTGPAEFVFTGNVEI
jgi:diaminopimelate epimerase